MNRCCEVCGDPAPKYSMGCVYPTNSFSDWKSPYCSMCIDITLLDRSFSPTTDGIISLFVDDQPATPENVRDLILEQKQKKKNYMGRNYK